LPNKNSAAYAILITLVRYDLSGNLFIIYSLGKKHVVFPIRLNNDIYSLKSGERHVSFSREIHEIIVDFSRSEKIRKKSFMLKKEPIDAAENSGLSRDGIRCCFTVNSCCFG